MRTGFRVHRRQELMLRSSLASGDGPSLATFGLDDSCPSRAKFPQLFRFSFPWISPWLISGYFRCHRQSHADERVRLVFVGVFKENDNEQSRFQSMGSISGEVAKPPWPHPWRGRNNVSCQGAGRHQRSVADHRFRRVCGPHAHTRRRDGNGHYQWSHDGSCVSGGHGVQPREVYCYRRPTT